MKKHLPPPMTVLPIEVELPPKEPPPLTIVVVLTPP